jgi:hypothetical protein
MEEFHSKYLHITRWKAEIIFRSGPQRLVPGKVTKTQFILLCRLVVVRKEIQARKCIMLLLTDRIRILFRHL